MHLLWTAVAISLGVVVLAKAVRNLGCCRRERRYLLHAAELQKPARHPAAVAVRPTNK